MNNLEITPLRAYDPQQPVDLEAAGHVVKTGFGGRTLAECIEDAQGHLQTAKLVQFAHFNKTLIGFAMYETFNQSKDLYLNGIVIQRTNQAQNVGTTMVRQACKQQQAERIFAVTRNPAIVRVMQSVCDYVQPSPEHAVGSQITDVQVTELADCIGLPKDDLPYHRGRYPEDLYDVEPRHANQQFQQQFNDYYSLQDPRDAVLLIGEVNNDN